MNVIVPKGLLVVPTLVLAVVVGQACTVRVINEATDPVPVTGGVDVAQSGDWVVELDPANSVLQFHEGPTELLFDSDLLALNNDEERELGSIDLRNATFIRLLAHGVNGRVHVEVLTDLPAGTIQLDEFDVGQEDTAEYETRLYEIPGPAMRFRVEEIGGPGGANIRLVLVGR